MPLSEGRMGISDYIGLGAIVVSIFTFAWMLVKDSKDKTGDAIKQLQLDVKALETKMEVFWRNVSFDAARNLHTPHPHNERRDYLLEQYMDEKISRSELVELIQMLDKLVKDDNNRDFGERQAASLLLRTIEQRFSLQK